MYMYVHVCTAGVVFLAFLWLPGEEQRERTFHSPSPLLLDSAVSSPTLTALGRYPSPHSLLCLCVHIPASSSLFRPTLAKGKVMH